MFRFVINICARFGLVMAGAMLLPAMADLHSGSGDWLVFIQSAMTIFIVSSLILVATRGTQIQYTIRLGFLLTVCLWVTACILGSLPLYYSHLPITFAQAVFEATSGVTTTGGTMLTGLDSLPRGILLWRSLMTWIGGVGFIAVTLLLLPSLRVGGMKLLGAESSNTSEKILPRMHQIGSAILLSYLMLSLICMLSYFAAGMTLFDAINHAMTTVATAGFSTHDASFGYYQKNPMILTVATVFMILSSLPFILYIKAALPRQGKTIIEPQVKAFLGVVLIAGIIIGLWVYFTLGGGFFHSILFSIFHFVSIISTTGFAIEDYSLWGPTALGIFFLAFFIGGCSGSTSGGLKMNRLIILWRLIGAKLTALISPHRVIKVYYGKTEISSSVSQNVMLFVCLYLFTLVLGSILLLIVGVDFVTAFTGAASAIANIGPGFGNVIGPVGNYSQIHDSALWILILLMFVGRLEIISVLVLFVPAFWQD